MNRSNGHTLVLGGIRSGKSEVAERWTSRYPGAITYLATATPGDAEMSQRIRNHQSRRPRGWGLREVPLLLGSALQELASVSEPPALLVDCMSLWMSNLLHAPSQVFGRERDAWLEALQAYPAPVTIVSNEVGLGVIGMDPLTRRFCDELGWLNQSLARQCNNVVLVVAGLELPVKSAQP
mgnify:CR=1 FL=1